MILPEIERRPFAAPDSLACRQLAGEAGDIQLPLFGDPVGPAASRARLGPEAFGSSTPPARAKLERILSGEGTLVTTGQQPVLFLGPLYVLYKTVTAIALASRVERETGAPALASFWIASDDHDWDEIGSTRLIDPRGRLQRLVLEPPMGHAHRAAGPTALTDAIEPLLAELGNALPASDFVEPYLAAVGDAYRPGATMAQAFAALLSSVLASGGAAPDWVWLDAADPRVKRASAPLFRRAIDEGGDVLSAFDETSARMSSLGLEPPITALEGGLPVFLDTGESRERLYRVGGGLAVGRGGPAIERERLLSHLEGDPDRFSPNVALRPVLESWLLPVSTTVLGPGEVAYWGQLHGLFQHFGVPMPAVAPRLTCTLIESKIARVLDKFEVSTEDLADGGEALTERITRDGRPGQIDQALQALRASLGTGFAHLSRAIAEELPGLKASAGKSSKAAFDVLSELGRQVDARVREVNQVAIDQVIRAAANLFPDGAPQERAQSPFYFLSRYGAGLVDALLREAASTVDRGTAPAAPSRVDATP